MLALATHDSHFRVLREDVFANDTGTSPSACRMCGKEGHYVARCTAIKAKIQKKPPPDKKPFIFLDVAILREYLQVELEVHSSYFLFHWNRPLIGCCLFSLSAMISSPIYLPLRFKKERLIRF